MFLLLKLQPPQAFLAQFGDQITRGSVGAVHSTQGSTLVYYDGVGVIWSITDVILPPSLCVCWWIEDGQTERNREGNESSGAATDSWRKVSGTIFHLVTWLVNVVDMVDLVCWQKNEGSFFPPLNLELCNIIHNLFVQTLAQTLDDRVLSLIST